MERKTHHESWVKLDSIKERFDLPHHHVYDFTQVTFFFYLFFKNILVFDIFIFQFFFLTSSSGQIHR